ncbi:MAG: YwqG family protein [Paracoccaceae bacterium]
MLSKLIDYFRNLSASMDKPFVDPIGIELEFDFLTRESLVSCLEKTGLKDRAHQISEAARETWRLHPSNGAPQIGQTKLGGLPDLPKGMEWPIRPAMSAEEVPFWPDFQREIITEPQPLSFVGQFDFGTISPEVRGSLGFPSRGLLSLFYDVEFQGWGFNPAHRDGFRVLFFEDTESLIPANPPSEDIRHFVELPMTGSQKLMPFPAPDETDLFDILGLEERQVKLYRKALSNMRDFNDRNTSEFGEEHFLGGYPVPVQSGMENGCAFVAAGMNIHKPIDETSSTVQHILKEPNDWRLLLQIDSDDLTDMSWGVGGTLYVWIRNRDLVERKFEQAWLILQTT